MGINLAEHPDVAQQFGYLSNPLKKNLVDRYSQILERAKSDVSGYDYPVTSVAQEYEALVALFNSSKIVCAFVPTFSHWIWSIFIRLTGADLFSENNELRLTLVTSEKYSDRVNFCFRQLRLNHPDRINLKFVSEAIISQFAPMPNFILGDDIVCLYEQNPRLNETVVDAFISFGNLDRVANLNQVFTSFLDDTN